MSGNNNEPKYFLLLSFGERFESFYLAKKYSSTSAIYGSKISSNSFKRHFLLLSRLLWVLKPRRSAAVFPSLNKRVPIKFLPFFLLILKSSPVTAQPMDEVPISRPIWYLSINFIPPSEKLHFNYTIIFIKFFKYIINNFRKIHANYSLIKIIL